jgi:hypothetical protein
MELAAIVCDLGVSRSHTHQFDLRSCNARSVFVGNNAGDVGSGDNAVPD